MKKNRELKIYKDFLKEKSKGTENAGGVIAKKYKISIDKVFAIARQRKLVEREIKVFLDYFTEHCPKCLDTVAKAYKEICT